MNNIIGRVNSSLIAVAVDKEIEITEELNLTDDLGIDSLGIIELVSSLEEDFDIMLDQEVMEKVHSVGDVYQALRISLA